MKTSFLQPQKYLDLLIPDAPHLEESIITSSFTSEIAEPNNERNNESENPTANESANKDSDANNKPGASNPNSLNFSPGTRLEAKGFSEEWYK